MRSTRNPRDCRALLFILAAALLISLTTGSTASGETGNKDEGPATIVWEGNRVISEDLEVGPGETLVIKPGSNVIFESNATLTVSGTLIVIGEAGAPIVLDGNLNFLPSTTEDGQEYYVMTPGSSVVLRGDATDDSIVDGAVISSLRLVLEGSSARISNSTFLDNSELRLVGECAPIIRDNQFMNNGVGEPSIPWFGTPYVGWRSAVWPSSTMTCEDGADALIINNTFFRNGGFALRIENALPSIVGNTFDSNRLGGIRAEMGEARNGTLIIQGNVFYNHGTVPNGNVTARDLSTSPKGSAGVYLLNASAEMSDNRFEHNDIGLVSVVPMMSDDLHIERSSMAKNGVGIYIKGGSLQVLDCSLDNYYSDLWLSGNPDVELVNTTLDEKRIIDEEEEEDVDAPAAPQPSRMLLGGSVIIGMVGGMLYGFSEVGRSKLFAFAFPLYAQLRGKDVLDHFLRGQLYGLIRGRPGIHYSKIKEVLEVGNGTLAYHLSVLEKEGFIKTKQLGTKKLYYPTKLSLALQVIGECFPLGKEPTGGIPLSDLQEEMVSLIDSRPGITQMEIANALGISKQRASYNIRNLALAEIITVVWEPKRTRCYPRNRDGGQVD